eukprot:GHUV01049409.1.p1 GENE.GHUV01049409.1~~GHUV01049409.1.p1  ORF type:complete len:104 (-),score=11.22 GHUV01049409.1:78-389(-)
MLAGAATSGRASTLLPSHDTLAWYHARSIPRSSVEPCFSSTSCRETLRLDPVIHQVVRITTRDFDLGGYGIPAGTRISLPLRYLAESEPRWIDGKGEPQLLLQ